LPGRQLHFSGDVLDHHDAKQLIHRHIHVRKLTLCLEWFFDRLHVVELKLEFLPRAAAKITAPGRRSYLNYF
jgi:hypothetical protein